MEFKLVKKLGVGSAGDAFLLEDGKAIVVGKREDSFGTYKALFEKMKKTDGKITAVNYPKIYQLVEPCQDFPFGAMVEECISGTELRKKVANLTEADKVAIGTTLAKFLREMHSIQSDGNKDEEVGINLAKYERSLGIIKDYLDEKTFARLVELKPRYQQLIQAKPFCTTHGDLNAGNIMIGDDNKLSGIIDFGNMEYYIPEIEFVHMYFFDRTIYDAMVAGYGRAIDEREVVLLELVVNVRHFKNIVKFDDKREHCLDNINKLLSLYADKNVDKCTNIGIC